jgi:hypothetical protein
MASFESTRSQFTQEHFEVFELDLPVITGTCTQGAANGFGTPLTCDQAWTSEYKTYKFTNENAPLLSGGSIYRYITKIIENPTELKPGNGLSARGSLTVTLRDFVADPNEGTAGVTTAVKTQGTFLGKLNARQIMENKTARLKLYRVQSDGSIDLAGGAETHHYIVESFSSNDNGTWTVQCKDVLSLANLDEKTWPPTAGGSLRTDINAATNIIPVAAGVDYSATFAIRIGDEFFRVTGFDATDPVNPFLNVAARGSTINAPVSGVFLTQTTADSHNAGDEVFICDLSDNETIDSLITRVLIASDFDTALIPAAALAAEVAEWHPNDKINTLHSEAEDVNDVLNKILTGFLMDLWFDQIDNEIKLSAISVWKESSSTLTEGKQIDAYTLKKTASESLRASRALVIYDKRNLADNDDVSSFTKAAQNANNQIISEALFKEHKDKRFDNNTFIGTNAANLLVQRTVARFSYTPFNYSGISQERFLSFNGVRVKTGDVINLSAKSIQSPNGLPASDRRAQITKIKPNYTNLGRTYNVTAMSYEAAFDNNSEIVIDEPIGNGFSLHTRAGGPAQPVTITFILDGSFSSGPVSFVAGGFAATSKIILILVNGFDGQADGGIGGFGESLFFDSQTSQWISNGPAQNGFAGGIVYDAQEIDTDVYFSGATPSTAFPTADGFIRAPGGGGGGGPAIGMGTNDATGYGGHGGGGGAGRIPGTGGIGGIDAGGSRPVVAGTAGQSGDTTGAGGAGGTGTPTSGGNAGNWGIAGASVTGGGSGGAAGSGIKDSGATVTLFGSSATRYINGQGDH